MALRPTERESGREGQSEWTTIHRLAIPNRQNLMSEERTQLTLATDREIRVPGRNGEAGTSTTERLRMRPFRQRGQARQGKARGPSETHKSSAGARIPRGRSADAVVGHSTLPWDGAANERRLKRQYEQSR